MSGEEAVIHSMCLSLFYHLFSEALPFMHTLSNSSQIAHWYSEVLISSWKSDGKRFLPAAPLSTVCHSSPDSFWFFFFFFCWVRLSHYPVSSWWKGMVVVTCAPSHTHAHTEWNPTRVREKKKEEKKARSLGRLQQYQHHLISVNTGALCHGWTHVLHVRASMDESYPTPCKEALCGCTSLKRVQWPPSPPSLTTITSSAARTGSTRSYSPQNTQTRVQSELAPWTVFSICGPLKLGCCFI